MKPLILVVALVVASITSAFAAGGASAATCTPTGLMRDGINLTAATYVTTNNTSVTGSLDATGCNIGVYFAPGTSGGSVTGAVFGASYYGVVVNAASADVTNANIHDIGDDPPTFSGAQHGVGVLYTTIDQAGTPTGESASGTLSGSTITNYQKNGVVVSGAGAAVSVENNIVTGLGRIDFIAQNGIEIALGGTALVSGNTVSGNWYTPATVTACGLLYFQSSGVKQSANKISGNQTNLCNASRGGGNFNS